MGSRHLRLPDRGGQRERRLLGHRAGPGGFVQERSGSACDSWHRYREDIRLAAKGGPRAYRFSIEWSRIEPDRGEFSRAALLHYRDMIDACHEHGLEPVVTLHHFASPRWFAALGGVTCPEAPALFAAYVRHVSQILGDVRWIVDINEPNILALMGLMHLAAGGGPQEPGETAGALGAGAESTASATGTTTETTPGSRPDGEHSAVTELMAALPAPPLEMATPIIAMHRAATAVLRETVPQARIGWAIAAQAFTPTPGNEEVFEQVFHQWEGVYLEACADDDFIGVQAYTSQPVDAHGPVPHPDSPDNSLSGWAWHPEALGLNLRRYHERYGKPMLVTENGISTADDARRIEYTTGALTGMLEAVRDGADVRGYCHWSLLDNYEWGRWEPTFGLIAVDRETFTRTPKPSLA